jgi:hypothetical protein
MSRDKINNKKAATCFIRKIFNCWQLLVRRRITFGKTNYLLINGGKSNQWSLGLS